MDRVNGLGSWVYDIVDWSWPLVLIRAAKILWDQMGVLDLIWVLDLTMDGSRHRMEDRGGTTSAAWKQFAGARHPRRSGAQFSMGFHPTTSWRCGKIVLLTFEQWQLVTVVSLIWAWAMAIGSSGGSPMMRRAPTGAVDLGEAFGMVGSVWEAAHRPDDEVGRWLGLGLGFAKIPHEGSPIYRCFDTHA
jgi:hypothetical protein